MWDELYQFLFAPFTFLGFEFENWMLLIGLPIVIIGIYFSERGWK